MKKTRQKQKEIVVFPPTTTRFKRKKESKIFPPTRPLPESIIKTFIIFM